MTPDRILEKEEFIQQYVFERLKCGLLLDSSSDVVEAAINNWNAIRKECDK